jgi:hypothetical protein
MWRIKDMERNTAIIIGLGVMAIFHTIAFGGDCLDARIWTDKDEFLSYEPIVIHYEITNNTPGPIVTTFIAYGEYFNILDQEGRRCQNTLSGCYLFGADTIGPGASYTANEQVRSRYNVNLPGAYTCYMELPKGNSFPECSEIVKSNELTLTVVEPKGEERTAFEMYRYADSLHWTYKSPKQKKAIREKAFYLYLDLVKKYPRSVYAPVALYSAIVMGNVPDDRLTLINACHTMIEEYPESPYLVWTFSDLCDYYKALEDKTGAIEYMEYLLKEYPDSKISDRAEYWLAKIKAGDF